VLPPDLSGIKAPVLLIHGPYDGMVAESRNSSLPLRSVIKKSGAKKM
jgi:hypothetical protein